MSLLLHCGSRLVEKQDVFDVETPESTDTYKPISHKFLIEEIETAINGVDLIVNDEAHALDKDGNRYFGMYEITSPEGSKPEDETSLILGARHSHDKSLSVEEIRDDRARSIIIEGAKRRVISGTKIIDVVKEWENPRYPEFNEWGNSMYKLHNAFTTVMKTANKNVFTLPQKTMDLQDLVKSAMIGFAA